MSTEKTATAATPAAEAEASAEAYQNVYEALRAVQAAAPKVRKDAKNPHFGSSYMSLDSIVDVVGPLLAEHGLVWTTLPGFDERGESLSYRLVHARTETMIAGAMPLLLAKKDSQGLGSALTYARRYSLCAVLNIVADDDDDGNAASARGAQRPQQAPLKPPLQDDEAKGLLADCRILYDKIKAISPGLIAQATYGGWEAGVQSSHDELRRLKGHLQGQLDALQGEPS